ncbi:MAG: ATP-binding protein [Bdellovibrionia bacterium]
MDDFEIEIKKIFLDEAQELLDGVEKDCLALVNDNKNIEGIENILRLAHTFKGSARAVGLIEFSEIAHELENFLGLVSKGKLTVSKSSCSLLLEVVDAFRVAVGELRKNISYQIPNKLQIIEKIKKFYTPELASKIADPALDPILAEASQPKEEIIEKAFIETVDSSPKELPSNKSGDRVKAPRADEPIKVSSQKLDRLIDLVGELTVHRYFLMETGTRRNEADKSNLEQGVTLDSASIGQRDYLDKIITEIYDVSMALRMTPIRPIFQRMQRTVWDLSVLKNKEIELILEGEEIELDKTIIDKVGETLIHLIRNAIDHGIEESNKRVAVGKTPKGTIRLSAKLRENCVVVAVSDDGNGLEKDRILKVAIERKLVSPKNNLTEAEIFALIFEPGFSTQSEVTDVSGRGVGMDVVQQSVRSVGGSIEIETKPHQGTRFSLTLPLNLSVIEGLVVQEFGTKYIVPLHQVLEIVDLQKHKVDDSFGKGRVLTLRGEVLPVFSLGKALDHTNKAPKIKFTEHSEAFVGLSILHSGKKVVFEVDEVLNHEPIVLKPLGVELQNIRGIIAGAILGNGDPILVINLQKLVPERSVGGNV